MVWWKVGATEVASVRSYQKLPSHLTEPKAANSKMAKAEIISNSGRASGTASLRMEKIIVPEPLQPEKEVRICVTRVGAV